MTPSPDPSPPLGLANEVSFSRTRTRASQGSGTEVNIFIHFLCLGWHEWQGKRNMSTDSSYSFSLTTFSRTGKLIQIEHALSAAQQGKASLGIRGESPREVSSV